MVKDVKKVEKVNLGYSNAFNFILGNGKGRKELSDKFDLSEKNASEIDSKFAEVAKYVRDCLGEKYSEGNPLNIRVTIKYKKAL